MSLLATERIKLFTTRSPWWCALLTVTVTVGLAAFLFAGLGEASGSLTVAGTQFGFQFGLAVILVLAALAVTTEYRFGTIRTTFQAVPHRGSVLAAKTVVVALAAFVIGEVAGFGSWALAKLLSPNVDLALNNVTDWTSVAGVGVVFAFAAVMALAVGILIRQSAGALSLLLVYTLAVEQLVRLIPKVGADIYEWLPFNVANKFLFDTGASNGGHDGGAVSLSTSQLSPAWALAYFAGVSLVLLAVAIGVAKKRDA
jgi:ABC-2 type transport system permease protein